MKQGVGDSDVSVFTEGKRIETPVAATRVDVRSVKVEVHGNGGVPEVDDPTSEPVTEVTEDESVPMLTFDNVNWFEARLFCMQERPVCADRD